MKFSFFHFTIIIALTLWMMPGCKQPRPELIFAESTSLPGRYVNSIQEQELPENLRLRQVTLDHNSERRTMTAVSAKTLPVWNVSIPEQGAILRFNIGIALAEAKKSNLRTTFLITSLSNVPDRTIWTETITLPAGETSLFLPREIDLTPYQGRTLMLEFISFDKALFNTKATHWWGNPILLPNENPTPPKTPVILISCDTLRADRLGCYGYERPTSLNIDLFANDAVRFSRAFANESWTLTAHMSMFTGLTPNHHGLTPYLNLPESIPTFPELLRDHGYTAAGFTGHRWWLMGSRGFSRGFDLYTAPIGHYRNVDAAMDEFYTDWFPKHHQESLFLFLHNYDIHDKTDTIYDAEDDAFRIFTRDIPAPSFDFAELTELKGGELLHAHNIGEIHFTAKEQEYINLTYDECVYKIDNALGKLFAHLKDTPFPHAETDSYYDRALIIVTADHGESLGEHDLFRHGNLYEDNIHIPLLIKFPQSAYAGHVSDALVDLTDFMPTILDVLEMDIPDNLDGISLLKLLEAEADPRSTLYFQRLRYRAIRNDQQKLIFNLKENIHEYYAIQHDPKELDNQYAPGLPETVALQNQLDTFFQPPLDGWGIQLHDPEGSLESTLTFTTDQPIEKLHMQEGFFVEKFTDVKKGRKTFTGYSQVTLEQPTLTLRVQTAPSDSGITLQTQTDKLLHVLHLPDLTPEYQMTFSLDTATAPTAPLDATALANADGPVLHVYYVPPAAKGEEAAPLSEQALEELEAIGYLEELQSP